MTKKPFHRRNTMLDDKPIEWLSVKVSSDAVDVIDKRRAGTANSRNDEIEAALNIIRKPRVHKLALTGKQSKVRKATT